MKWIAASLTVWTVCFLGLPAQAEAKENDSPIDVSAKSLPDYWWKESEATTIKAHKKTTKAIKGGAVGCVAAEVTINSKGRVREIQILESVPAGAFDKSAKALFKKHRYQPGPANEDRMPVRSTLSAIFGAKDDPALKDAGSPCVKAVKARDQESSPEAETPQS